MNPKFLPLSGNVSKLVEWYRTITPIDKRRILQNCLSQALVQANPKEVDGILLDILAEYGDFLSDGTSIWPFTLE